MNAPRPSHRRFFHAVITLASLLVASVASAASAAALNLEHAAVRAVVALQADVTPGLMSSAAILGTAVGVDDTDHPVLVVYVDRDNAGVANAIRAVPLQLRGIGVKVEVTEKFRAFKGPPVAGVSHTAKQTAPIQLGTSGGWSKDLANGYCCGGTLGSLVKDGSGAHYILSNYHVLEADIVGGGNSTVAATGDNVIQPGLIDVSCNAANAQNVATLVKLSSLPSSNVDCAVARVVPGMVRTDGAILEIGTISSPTVAAALNQAVKKSGRTSGLTRSKISGLNATISVTYDNECAGGTAFTKTFTGQIVIANGGSRFLKGGDSGSLMVEDAATNPRAVGLLYAGSSTSAIANPIDEVLGFLSTWLGSPVTMVGN